MTPTTTHVVTHGVAQPVREERASVQWLMALSSHFESSWSVGCPKSCGIRVNAGTLRRS
jgi:hypothetical protein